MKRTIRATDMVAVGVDLSCMTWNFAGVQDRSASKVQVVGSSMDSITYPALRK